MTKMRRVDENTVLKIDPTFKSYESPITRITEETIKRVIEGEEGYLMECVRNVGFNIDKEELRKALLYDRDQYEKGYSDGRMARDAEIVRCKECKWYRTEYSWNCKEHKVCGIEPFMPLRKEEDFCSHGERRTDDDRA